MFQTNAPQEQERGVSMYIAFMIMTTLLGIALGVSALLFAQLGILRGMGHSVFAFYATEAGVERALYIDNTFCLEEEEHAPCLAGEFDAIGASPPGSVSLSNGASYQLVAEDAGEGGCPNLLGYNYCVKVTGSYQEARRAVRVAR
ncbi:MAG: hypothetical protein Q8P12_04205 [bacterium]|nr:hypothetical protein [bacterium]